MAHSLDLPFCVRTAQSLVKSYIYPFNRFEKKVFGWCQRWVAGGHLVHEAMNTKGWGGERGVVLSLGVNTEKFSPFSEAAKAQGRKKLGFGEPLIGYLGRLSEEKGMDLIMEVMSQLKDRPWSFLFMGSGPCEQKVKDWAAREGLSDRVQVKLYSHNEIPEVLPLCDLLLCPSQTRPFWKEQFGRMLVEAFASGVPVVASSSGEIPRVVGDAGVILPEADSAPWKETILRLLADPKEREEWSQRGLKRAEEYSVRSMAEKYKVFYREILSL